MRSIPDNKTIVLWLKKRCGSERSLPKYTQTASQFFEHMKMQPDDLVAEWKKAKYDSDARVKEQFIDEMTEKIEAYIYQHCGHYAPYTRRQALAIIKSFFICHRIPVSPEPEKRLYKKYHNRAIKREEIRRILEHSTLRERTFFLMMAESGLRPLTLVQLRYKHIKKDFKANRVPMMIELPSELLKDRVEARWTFIGEDGFKTLRQYLHARLPLDNEDLIFAPERSDMKHGFVSPTNFTNKFSSYALKLRIAEKSEYKKPKQIRLYCLRKYFNNNLRADRSYIEWWMGHKTTQTDYVDPDPERHREEYAQAYQNLRIYKSESEQSVRQLRELLAKKEEELAELRKSLKLIQPLLELAERNPKILQGMCDRERQRLLRLTEKWSNRARRKK